MIWSRLRKRLVTIVYKLRDLGINNKTHFIDCSMTYLSTSGPQGSHGSNQKLVLWIVPIRWAQELSIHVFSCQKGLSFDVLVMNPTNPDIVFLNSNAPYLVLESCFSRILNWSNPNTSQISCAAYGFSTSDLDLNRVKPSRWQICGYDTSYLQWKARTTFYSTTPTASTENYLVAIFCSKTLADFMVSTVLRLGQAFMDS